MYQLCKKLLSDSLNEKIGIRFTVEFAGCLYVSEPCCLHGFLDQTRIYWESFENVVSHLIKWSILRQVEKKRASALDEFAYATHDFRKLFLCVGGDVQSEGARYDVVGSIVSDLDRRILGHITLNHGFHCRSKLLLALSYCLLSTS